MESSKDKAERVIGGLFEGYTLRKALRDVGMGVEEFFRVLGDDVGLVARYNMARVVKADLMADEMLEVADDGSLEVGRAANMLNARKWVASKYNPKVYGEKLDVQVTKTVDITAALEDARSRVEAIEGQVVVKELEGEVKDGESA